MSDREQIRNLFPDLSNEMVFSRSNSSQSSSESELSESEPDLGFFGLGVRPRSSLDSTGRILLPLLSSW